MTGKHKWQFCHFENYDCNGLGFFSFKVLGIFIKTDQSLLDLVSV